jgi:hypothetical protein
VPDEDLADAGGGASMSETVGNNAWAELIHHTHDGILELRWLPVKMTDSGFKATLALLALEAERLRPPFLLIDATEFRHEFGPGVMEWRDNCIIPRYGAAGTKKFAVQVPDGFPDTIEVGGKESMEDPAIFQTAWFSKRQNALAWFKKD